MSTRNATASWSGFSHQGRIGLLLALKKIQEIEDCSEYCIDYEQQEDVRILENENPIEVHQVKAYINKDTKGSYTDALKKFEACDGENYLHTIVNVRLWDELTAEENPEGVKLYEYNEGVFFCDLQDIENYILEEIGLLLEQQDHEQSENEAYQKEVYSKLLAELDEILRKAHHRQDYEPRLALDRIKDIVINDPNTKRSQLFALRERLYSEFVEYIRVLEELDIPVSDKQEKYMRACIKSIYCLDDVNLEQFFRNINPHTTFNKKLPESLTTGDFFSGQSFSKIFLEVLHDVSKEELQLNRQNVPHYFKVVSYILTTIDQGGKLMPKVAMQIAENTDIDFSGFEAEYLITENYKGLLKDLAGKMKSYDSRKFFRPNEMKFIGKKEAIDKLNA